MQTKIAKSDKCHDQPMRLTQKIGPTTYKVNVHFSESSKETISDKIIRMIEKEVTNQ